MGVQIPLASAFYFIYFVFEVDNKRYGSVPILVSHDAQKTVGVFWLNPSEMYIDVSDGSDPVVCGYIAYK